MWMRLRTELPDKDVARRKLLEPMLVLNFCCASAYAPPSFCGKKPRAARLARK